jgi:hypothetical protein
VRAGVVAGLDAPVEWFPADGAAALWLAPAAGLPEWLAAADAEDFAGELCTPVAITDGGISGVEPGELVHAQTVAETRTVKIAQLTALEPAPNAVLGLIMRTFMTPPYMPGRQSYR